VDAEVDTVSVEVGVPALSAEGLKLALAPKGNPETLSPTLPLNPFKGTKLMVYLPTPPGATVCPPGLIDPVKSVTAKFTPVL
jgi:hypothetical protein